MVMDLLCLGFVCPDPGEGAGICILCGKLN